MLQISAIQHYCIHDGDGIRTTVFFRGCPLGCLWCHNPETQPFKPVLLETQEKCTGCGECVSVCPEGAVRIADGKARTDRESCIACGTCTEVCPGNLREVSGTFLTVENLFAKLRKDRAFYEESGGGVTLSGGEVLMQDTNDLKKLMAKLKEEDISAYVDTCGYADWSRMEAILPYTDIFLYDMKLLDPLQHVRYTGRDNACILANLVRLSEAGARIYIRIPLIPEVNGSPAVIRSMAEWLKSHQIRTERIYLIPYHNAGSSKYPRLGIAYRGTAYTVPAEETMTELQQIFLQAGFRDVRIGG